MPTRSLLVSALLTLLVVAPASRAQATNPYPSMAPLDQYLIPSKDAEIALARTAAPASISGDAEIMVLTRDGYATAVKGSNGFLCLVERGWANATDQPDYWNPKLRAPHCFNEAAAKSFAQVYLFKTKLILAGKSKSEALAAVTAAFDKKQLPPVAPGSMVYMMSKEQNLGNENKSWHPHLMFIAPGSVEKSWGANLPGSPILASDDPEERATIFLVVVPKWSDGSPGPSH